MQIGTKVRITRNNYNSKLYQSYSNQIGMIQDIIQDDMFEVEFKDGRILFIMLSEMEELT
jgi:trans-2-enoyl-CoA reductase